MIANTLSRRIHIDHLITKLSAACYVIRSVKTYMSHKTLLSIYCSLIQTVMNYWIIFWGNSYHNPKLFRMQKTVIRIIMFCGIRDSCWNLFKKLKILPLMPKYILSLLIFLVNNRDQFLIYSEIQNINTRHISNLHVPLAYSDVY